MVSPLPLLPRTIASSIPSRGVRRKVSSSTRRWEWMGAKSCTSWWKKSPWFVGFQHVSTIRLVVQDFAGPSTVFRGMNIDEHWWTSICHWFWCSHSRTKAFNSWLDVFLTVSQVTWGCALFSALFGAARFEDYPGGVKTRFKLGRAEVMPYIYVPWPPVAMISGVEATRGLEKDTETRLDHSKRVPIVTYCSHVILE